MPAPSGPNDPQARVTAGDVLAGKYVVEGVLGVGGMGTVLRAWHRDLEQRVAIKVMLRELATNPEAEARFLREARASVKLRSEHVARVFDVARLETGEPFMVMEFLEGKDLSVVLAERGTLPVQEAVDLVLQASEAVEEAHSVGIIHRDLKPPNLFLTNDAYGTPVIKVLDFGISKLHQPDSPNTGPALTGISVVMGTPNYMSPEQMRSARSADARSDIWSIGAILFELLTGRLAFEGEGLTEVIAAVLTQPTPQARRFRPEVPEALDQVIARCLAKEPDARFASVPEFVHAAAPFGAASSSRSRQRMKLERRAVAAATLSPVRPALEIVPSEEDDLPAARIHSQPTHVAWGKAGAASAESARPPSRGGARLLWIALAAALGVAGAAWIGLRRPPSVEVAPGPDEGRPAASAPSIAAQPPLVPPPESATAPASDPPSSEASSEPGQARQPGGRRSTARSRDSASAAASAAAPPSTVPPAVESAPPAVAAATASAGPAAAPPGATQTAPVPPTATQTAVPQPPPTGTITDFGGRE